MAKVLYLYIFVLSFSLGVGGRGVDNDVDFRVLPVLMSLVQSICLNFLF